MQRERAESLDPFYADGPRTPAGSIVTPATPMSNKGAASAPPPSRGQHGRYASAPGHKLPPPWTNGPSPTGSAEMRSPVKSTRKPAATAASLSFPALPSSFLPPTLPSWPYIFKPLTGLVGSRAPVGRLVVRVLRAKNLQPTEPLFGSTHHYVTAKVGSNGNGRRTLTTTADVSPTGMSIPVWDKNDTDPSSSLVFDVSNVQEKLSMDLYESFHIGSTDEKVASVTLPLQELVRSNNAVTHPDPSMRSYRVTAWLPLRVHRPSASSSTASVSLAWRAQQRAMAAVSAFFNPSEWATMSEEKRAKKLDEIRKKKQSEWAKAAAAASATRVGNASMAPQLEVELTYTFSKVGEFFSYFTPQPSVPLHMHGQETNMPELDMDEDVWQLPTHHDSSDITTFNLETCYQLLRKTIALFWPIYAAVDTLLTALSPTNPSLCILLSALLLACAFDPSLFLPLILLFILRHLVWTYIYHVRSGGKLYLMEDAHGYASQQSGTTPVKSSRSSEIANDGADSKNGNGAGMRNTSNHTLSPSPAASTLSDPALVFDLTRALFPLLCASFTPIGWAMETARSQLARIQSAWQAIITKAEDMFSIAHWRESESKKSRMLIAITTCLLGYCCFASQTLLAIAVASFFVVRLSRAQPQSSDRSKTVSDSSMLHKFKQWKSNIQ